MASAKFTVQELEKIFPVHPSVTNGFMCANCGVYMNPPYILYCGHSVCGECLKGKPSASGLMCEISCRPCGKTVVRTSFLKSAENEALKGNPFHLLPTLLFSHVFSYFPYLSV